MDHFHYLNGELCCEGVSLRAIADSAGTPAYVYSKAALLENLAAYDRAFASVPHLVCYAVKANSNLGVLATLARAGAGADIVSGGELHRALRAGVPPQKITFAGVGKTREEMREALKAEILVFNVESASELAALNETAQASGVRAPVAVRVNPGVDSDTHPYIATGMKTAKFGIPIAEAVRVYEEAAGMPGISVIGVQMHIGSQLTKTSPFADAVARLAELVLTLRTVGIDVRLVDVGGGLGIQYKDEVPPSPDAYASVLLPALRPLGVVVLLEPGRSIVGNAGVLVTRALYRRVSAEKTFVIVDAGMNDLIRPALYGAYHEIRPVLEAGRRRPGETVDVVGPICESGDFLARDRELPRVEEDDLLAVMSSGAYGFAMASNYNARPRAAEILVDDRRYTIVRRRETYEDLVAGESLP
ncbi:MAG: diaminopimelate decarboxylase [Candidatus Rokuibacteriota bacterium]|nr:MAG: diaminopimelate decarboxylase [Candidatus Rokubacteria bacterium]